MNNHKRIERRIMEPATAKLERKLINSRTIAKALLDQEKRQSAIVRAMLERREQERLQRELRAIGGF